MSVQETLLDKAKSYLKQHEISFSDAVIISNLGMHSKKNHILVLSGFDIIILTQKKVSKNIAKKYDKSIFDISSISLSTLFNIEINFRKTKSSNEFKLIFQIEDCQKIIYMIVNYIHRLLAPFEFNRITIDESATPPTLAPRTSHSVLSRLNLQLEDNEIEVPENLLKKVSHHLYSHLNSFIFSKFRKMKKFFPIFFPCMSMARWVNQIDIYSPKHVFRLMFKQMDCFDNIVHVKIRGTESKELQNFVEQSKNVNSLSFHDRPVKTFDFVSVLIQNHKVDSIGFDSALDDVSYRLFMNSPSFDQLSYFRVSNLSQLDFMSYFQKFRQLKVLSLTSCNLKIGKILEELITNQVTTLKKLDLSGNIGDGFQRFFTRIRKGVTNQQQQLKRPKTLGPSNKLNLNHPGFQETDKTEVKISLPCKLDALFVNEVEWDVDQLIFFMRLCSNSVITNLSMNTILFLNPNSRNNQSGTNNNNENHGSKRKRNRRRSSSRNNNNNDDDQNIEEEEEPDDEDDDYDEDDEDDSEFAMNSSNEIINYNKKSNSANDNDVANWSALFDNFPKQMNSIRSLNWNSNKITNEFVNFLLASARLNEISFCGCNCSDISFIETLLKKHRIQKVNLKQIQFNTNLLYFNTFKNFLSNISQMKSVKQIDLSHNKIDDDCFDTLSTSLMKSNLEFIALDNSNASSSDFLYQFYHKLEKSKEQPITISYPFIDFQRLEVDKFKEYNFIQCFSNLKKPLSKRTTEIPKYLPEVSFLRLDNNFPQFLSKDRNGTDLNRNQTPPITNEQIPSTNNDNDNNNDETNNKNNKNTNNHKRTQSVNNVKININFDDDDDDDFPKPKNINSRNSAPKINSRRAPNTYYFNDDSTSEETPRSTFKKPQHKNTTNNRKFFSPNRIVTNLNFDDDDDSDNNNHISTKNSSSKRSSSTTNQRSNNFKSTTNNKQNKNLSPTSLNRQSLDDSNYNNNFIKHSRKNSDFMNFSPSSDRRKWIRQEPENWKPRVLPIPPKIDNTEIFINYNREFSIQRLTNKMVKK